MYQQDLATPAPPAEVNNFVTALQGLSEDDPDPTTITKRFYCLMKLGQHAKAINAINLLLELLTAADEKRCDMLHAKAVALSCTSDFEEALLCIDEALQIKPDYAAGVIGRGIIRRKHGDLKGGLDDLTRGLEMQPSNIEAHEEKAKAETELGESDAAAKSLEQAKHLYLSRARYFLQSNKMQLSLNDLCSAIRIDERFWEALIQRAKLWFRVGAAQAAQEDLAKVISGEPSHCLAHQILAELHWKLNQRQEAVQIQTQALKTIDKQFLWVMLLSRAEYLLELDRQEQAMADLDFVLKEQPNHTIAKLKKGQGLFELKRYEEALELILQIDPTEKDLDKGSYFHSLAAIYLKLGNQHKFNDTAEKLLEACPTNALAVSYKVEKTLDHLMKNQTATEEREKKLEELLVMLNGSIAANQRSATRLYDLKDRVLTLLNRIQQVIEMLKQVCKQSDSSIIFHQRLVDILIELRLSQDAEKALEQEAKHFPEQEFLLKNHRGRIQMLKGNTEEAIKLFKELVPKTSNEEDVRNINLATCYGRAGNPSEVVKSLESIKEDSSQWKTATLLLGAAYFMLQHWQIAFDTINKIPPKQLNHVESERVHLMRGMTLLFLKREKEALAEFELGDKQEPLNFWMGFALLRLNDIPGAVRKFSSEIKINPKHDLSYLYRATCFAIIRHFKEALLDLEREEALGGKPERSYIMLRACIHFLSNQMNDCEKDLNILEQTTEEGHELWVEYEEKVKVCLRKAGTIVRGLMKACKLEENREQARSFVMELVRILPSFVDPTATQQLDQLQEKSEVWAKSLTPELAAQAKAQSKPDQLE